MKFISLVRFTGQGSTHVGQTTDRANLFIKQAADAGANISDIFWTQGRFDGVLIFEAPDVETAAAITVRLCSQGNVQTETMVAFDTEGMTRVLGPISLSIWEEPGLLVKGQDHAPVIMMGHHPASYAGWIESYGFTRAKTLFTYDLDISNEFPPLVQRIVKSGARNSRINVRKVRKSDWDTEAATVLSILNDAWSDNWGFVPFTPEEVAYAGKKLKTIIHEELNMIAEVDGRPVAFMLTFPDMNDVLAKTNGKLFPTGWFHILRWLRKPFWHIFLIGQCSLLKVALSNLLCVFQFLLHLDWLR